MSRKSSKKQSLGSRILGIIAAVLIGIVLFLAQIFGLIPSDTNLTATAPASTAVTTRATSTPSRGTAVPTSVAVAPGNVTTVTGISQGFGAKKGFWDVYFTAPTGNSDRATYVNGIDHQLAKAIDGVTRTLDIAAFEWNSVVLTKAVLDAKKRGVTIRMVADNEHTIEDEDTTLKQLIDAGIPVTYDQRSAFMHNKFMILDSSVVWTGSTNYTSNDVYRNNNNMMALRSRRAVEIYQNEFNQMFTGKVFGPRKQPFSTSFTQDGTSVQIYFAPAANVLDAVNAELNTARSTIRFMAFSFTEDSIAQMLLARAAAGVKIEGIFETRGSETQFSELRPLKCAGLDVRQDGNGFTLHHKVFIIDNTTVVTGSFNFSANATTSNDENLVIIKDPDLVAQYVAEYERLKAVSRLPAAITCS